MSTMYKLALKWYISDIIVFEQANICISIMPNVIDIFMHGRHDRNQISEVYRE